MARRVAPAIAGLPLPQGEPAESLTKAEVAQLLGCPLNQVTRDSAVLWGEDTKYQRLSEGHAWMLYCVACYRAKRYQVDGVGAIRRSEILRFASAPESVILALVEAVGGSRADFDKRIRATLSQRDVSRFRRGLELDIVAVSI